MRSWVKATVSPPRGVIVVVGIYTSRETMSKRVPYKKKAYSTILE